MTLQVHIHCRRCNFNCLFIEYSTGLRRLTFVHSPTSRPIFFCDHFRSKEIIEDIGEYLSDPAVRENYLSEGPHEMTFLFWIKNNFLFLFKLKTCAVTLACFVPDVTTNASFWSGVRTCTTSHSLHKWTLSVFISIPQLSSDSCLGPFWTLTLTSLTPLPPLAVIRTTLAALSKWSCSKNRTAFDFFSIIFYVISK